MRYSEYREYPYKVLRILVPSLPSCSSFPLPLLLPFGLFVCVPGGNQTTPHLPPYDPIKSLVYADLIRYDPGPAAIAFPFDANTA